jgi:hypothetical protein
MLKYAILITAFLCVYVAATAQQLKTSFESLHEKRINTDRTGVLVLGSWGAVNVLGGVTGYIIADGTEAQAFHGMNAIWGAVNFGIATAGYIGNRKEANKEMDCSRMLHRYEATKRLYLLNAGLDVLYVGTGVVLNAKADEFNNPVRWRGYGKSIAMQGVALLIFDGTMFAMHHKQNKKWYKLLQGVCVTGDGIGFKYGI